MDKKGLSTIVVTLIIILVSLVAVGIIWVVVRNLVTSGSGQIDVSAKCLNVDIEASAVSCSSTAGVRICNVTFTRSGTGTEVVGGVKLIFRNTTAGTSSPVINILGDVDRLVGRTESNVNTNLSSVNRVEVTTYFKDSSGNDQICLQTNPYSF